MYHLLDFLLLFDLYYPASHFDFQNKTANSQSCTKNNMYQPISESRQTDKLKM